MLLSTVCITVPEDIGHALVQIRTTGPGGDGVPAEVHIVRNGGAVSPVSPRKIRVHPDAGIIPAQASPQGDKRWRQDPYFLQFKSEFGNKEFMI